MSCTTAGLRGQPLGATGVLLAVGLAFVGVSSQAQDGDLRLADVEEAGTGQLEIHHAGAWGGVCGNYWLIRQAHVACRQLGYPEAKQALGYPGAPAGAPFLLDNLWCEGSEARLADCLHSGWGVHDCAQGEYAGVKCGLFTWQSELVVAPRSVHLTEEDSTGGSYQAHLGREPSADVTVTVTAPSGVTASPASLAFTAMNWSTPRTVTLTAAADTGAEAADVTVTVTHTVAGATEFASRPAPSVTVHVWDDDLGQVAGVGATAVPANGSHVPADGPVWGEGPGQVAGVEATAVPANGSHVWAHPGGWGNTVCGETLSACLFRGPGVRDCRDAGGGCAAAGAPLLQDALASGPRIILRYDTELDAGSAPSGEDFAVWTNLGGQRTRLAVEAVTVTGAVAQLALARPVSPGETLTLDYLVAPMHPLQDAAGAAAPPLDNVPLRHDAASPWADYTGRRWREPLSALLEDAHSNPRAAARLDLSFRGLTGISFLSGLTGLRELDLRGNGIADLTPLSGLTDLRRLDLSDNAVVDVSPLAGLAALRRLDLSGNAIEAVDALSGLSGLEVLLLHDNNIAHLAPLSWPPGLTHLGLSGNRITDIALLAGAASLRRLDLSRNGLADLSPLNGLAGLAWLRLGGNPMQGVAPPVWLTAPGGPWLDTGERGAAAARALAAAPKPIHQAQAGPGAALNEFETRPRGQEYPAAAPSWPAGREKTRPAVALSAAGRSVSPGALSLIPVGKISDTADLALNGAEGIVIFESGGVTYAAIAAKFDHGVQILSLADPANPAPVGNISNTPELELSGARGIALFESGGVTYAAVAAGGDDGVQILSLADLADPAPVGKITDTAGRKLDGPRGITTFESGGVTYAAVASYSDNGVQILSLADPANPAAVGKITDYAGRVLDGACHIITFEHGGVTYAAVTSPHDNGVQILSLANPARPAAVGSITGDALLFDGANAIATFESGGITYAAVASFHDGVQVISLANPVSPAAAGGIADNRQLVLDGANYITTFESGGVTYAAVPTYNEFSVQVISLADPANPAAAASIVHGGGVELERGSSIASFKSGGATYLLATSLRGVQILGLNHSPIVNAGANQRVVEGDTVTLQGTASDADNDNLAKLWSHNSSLPISLADDTASTATFTAPAVSADTTVTFTLTADDGDVSIADSVEITVLNRRNFNALRAAGNTTPRGFWGNGAVMWVSEYHGSKLYAYSMANGSHLPSRDIETAAGNSRPTDLWSDGETLWVADTYGKLYAYRLSDGERRRRLDIRVADQVPRPSGVWSDGETLWVIGMAGGTAYAYTLADGSRDQSQDFEVANTDGLFGIWSDGDTFYIVDWHALAVYAYRDGARVPDAEIATPRNDVPSGLWSDGNRLWVSEHQGNSRLVTYALPVVSSNAALTLLRVPGVDLEPFSPARTAYQAEVEHDTQQVTLTAYAAAGASLAHATADADTASAGHQADLAIGANELALTVTAADGAATRTYTVTLTREAMPASTDATLSGLTLSGVDIGTFSGTLSSYTASVAHDVETTTVTAAANHAEAVVSINPGAEVTLAEGENQISVTVTAEDGTTTQTYTVTVTRAAAPLTAWFGDLPESHDGSAEFELRLRFSLPLSRGSAAKLRGGALTVENGTLSSARRVNRDRAVWRIVIAPSGAGEVTVTLAAEVACDAGGVCTENGRQLSAPALAAVPGLPTP